MSNEMELSRQDKINLLVKQHLAVERQKRKMKITDAEWGEAIYTEITGIRRDKK